MMIFYSISQSRATGRALLFLAWAVPAMLAALTFSVPARAGNGTLESPIVDSALTPRQAIHLNQPPGTPDEILENLVVVDVRYFSMDGLVHQGQVVIHKDLADDVRTVFELILKSRFPVAEVLPIAHPEIQKKGPFGLSSDTDNTSGYVFRKMVKGKKLSMHARGMALDLNPRQNPYIKGETVLPPGSVYDPFAPGTLGPDHPVVLAFKALGWSWGGDWTSCKDYMHFEKPVE